MGDSFMEKYILIFQENSIPKYVQLYKYIKNMIDKNKIKDNEKLPSIRKLSNLLAINTVTVINAYKKLENDGYAIQKQVVVPMQRKRNQQEFKKRIFRFNKIHR